QGAEYLADQILAAGEADMSRDELVEELMLRLTRAKDGIDPTTGHWRLGQGSLQAGDLLFSSNIHGQLHIDRFGFELPEGTDPEVVWEAQTARRVDGGEQDGHFDSAAILVSGNRLINSDLLSLRNGTPLKMEYHPIFGWEVLVKGHASMLGAKMI